MKDFKIRFLLCGVELIELRGANNCVDLFILHKIFQGQGITKWLDK